jgi:hypothetical protein
MELPRQGQAGWGGWPLRRREGDSFKFYFSSFRFPTCHSSAQRSMVRWARRARDYDAVVLRRGAHRRPLGLQRSFPSPPLPLCSVIDRAATTALMYINAMELALVDYTCGRTPFLLERCSLCVQPQS